VTKGGLPRVDRQDRALDWAMLVARRRSQSEVTSHDVIQVDDYLSSANKNTVTKLSDDEIEVDVSSRVKKTVDVKNRGRPRLHADGAARKRAWAARQRAKKKAESAPAKKRGRPRKYATQAERQKAYAERSRRTKTGA
jgi:hypothetical protein